MLNSLGLGFIFTAKDLASGKMAGLQRRFSSLDDAVGARGRRMSRAFRELGVGLAVFTAGAVGLGGTFALANRAGKFEQGLAGVGAVTKATAADMDMLHKSAIDAGIATQFSPDEAVEGLTSLATAGQTARQATETLIPVLDLAAGSLGQLGVSESAEAVVGTLNAYGIAARDAAGVTDKLLRITQLTNFQARDFEAGLSKAAATGAVFDQSLNDVLVTMGLIRNRNIDASSAATGFREATRRVGSDLGAQKALMSAGIDIFDKSTGKMRSIVDIMLEFSKASSDLTDKERNKIIVQAFGARGLLAYNAVSKAAFTTQRDGREVTLKGAEAVEALRKEMEKSGGTAKEFRERLLDTFQGQKTLLKGSLQTLAVVVGEAFSKVFKPVVSGIITVVNDAIYAWERLSPAVKSVIAKLLVFASTFLAVLGAVMALKGAFAMIRIGMAALGITFSGFLATFGPILLLIGGAAVVFYGFRQAFDRNFGGIADTLNRVWSQVKLFFQGLVQLFTDGGFSGAVMEDLAKAENQGLKSFLVGIYQFVHRLGVLWEGIKAGFSSAIEAGRPAFEAMATALGRLWDAASKLFGAIFGWTTGASEGFGAVGVAIGQGLGTAVEWIATAIGWVADLFGGFFEGLMRWIEPIKQAFAGVFGAIGQLIDTIAGIFGEASGKGLTFGDVLNGLGRAIGWVAGLITTVLVTAIEAVIDVITTVIDWIKGFGTAIGEGLGAIVIFFGETLPNALASAWETIKGWFGKIGDFFVSIGQWFSDLFSKIADGIVAFFQPVIDFFNGIADAISSAINAVIDTLINIARAIPSWMLPESIEDWVSSLSTSEEKQAQVYLEQRAPAVAQFKADEAANPEVQRLVATSEQGGYYGAFAEMQLQMMQAVTEAQANAMKKPVEVRTTLEVDGQKLAEVMQRVDRDSATRGFSPVPTY